MHWRAAWLPAAFRQRVPPESDLAGRPAVSWACASGGSIASQAAGFRLRGDAMCRPVDYWNAVRGVIRTRLEDAFLWLGEGALLDVHHLFPPPVYDHGYEYLLCSSPPGKDYLGAINHIGA